MRDVSPDAMAELSQYTWPGNLRELQSVLKQALLRSTGSVLMPSMLPELTKPVTTAKPSQLGGSGLKTVYPPPLHRRFGEVCWKRYVRSWTGLLLPLVMEQTRGNQFQAAKVPRRRPANAPASIA